MRPEIVDVPILPRLHVLKTNRPLERHFVTPADEPVLFAGGAFFAVSFRQGIASSTYDLD